MTERDYACVCARVCVCVSVCERAFVRACVRVFSRASPIFTRMHTHVRLWEEGGKEKYV